MTENLSNQSLGPVSLDGAPQFLRRGDAQTAHGALVGQDEYRREATMDAKPALVDILKFGAAADMFVRPEPRQLSLFAADGQPFAALRAAPFQNQTAVFRAHSDEKAVRPLAVARIRLKRAYSLGHDIPSR
jgi:hypothetical protein